MRALALRISTLLLMVTAGLATVAAAQSSLPTPAGSVVRNQASAVLGDERILSNPVETIVRTVCLPDVGPNGSVASPGQLAAVGPLQYAYLPYTLANAGNAAATFTLGWAIDAASGWTPSEVALYLDVDADGRLDSGEPLVDQVRLAYGERVRLLLAVQRPGVATGDALVTPTAACPSGELDEDNYARLRAEDGPALQLVKSASQAVVLPGEAAGFEIDLQNVGSQATGGPVTLTDRFDRDELDGLTYQPGSLTFSRGVPAYFDGVSWGPDPGDEVLGVRVVVDGLAPGEIVRVAFRMEVDGDAAPGGRRNVALAEGPGGPAQVAAEVEVEPFRLHHLGPVGNPRALPGGEGGPDDVQRGALSERACFEHTLENAGNVADAYRIEVSGLPSGIAYTLDLREGVPLTNPVALDAGASTDFLLCLTNGGGIGTFQVTLTATSLANDSQNRTVDIVDVVAAGASVDLDKRADAEGAVALGTILSYTLRVTNDGPIDLTDVVVEDVLQLPARLSGTTSPDQVDVAFVSASDGGSYDPTRRTVRWRVPTLAAGAELELELAVRLPDSVPLGAVFEQRNRFTLNAQEIPAPLTSNEVVHYFPEIELTVDKTVVPDVVRVGDAVEYTVEVRNPNEIPLAIELRDAPPARTAYIDGSATFTLGSATRSIEPDADGDDLYWDLRDVDDLQLVPYQGEGTALVLTYRLALLPGTTGSLRNTVQATGRFESSVAGVLTVASNEAAAVVTIEDEIFDDPRGTLLGRVYLDRDDDGRYTIGRDTPLPGARVLLANGVQALTDVQGRYAFRDVRPGTHAVMLDPASAPFAPRPDPEGLGDGYRHRVVVQGVTVSDFPLVPLGGAAAVARTTTLQLGPLQIDKRHVALPDGVRVVLIVRSDVELPDLRISDPVPDAQPRVFTFPAFVGSETLTYDLPGDPPLTDPDATWSYP